MSISTSLTLRAILAIGLMVGFYLLAVTIAAGLLFVPYAELRYAHRLHIRLAAFCLIGGVVVLWSILPRFDRFTPPGPALQPKDQPRLFEILSDMALSAEQSLPSEVYLIPEVNAWVAQRGGIMGIGSRRVMGIGLPLLQILTISQLKAILAHEFGHYYRGDTKLGPWIYKTRAAIGRTLENLSGVSETLQAPFLWYGKMFLRITHAVSRRQELVADQLAAQKVGAKPLTDGLKSVSGKAGAFSTYLMYEVMPILNAGFRPPISEGFARFMSSKSIQVEIANSVKKELDEGTTNPYETHPSLRERLEAVKDLPKNVLSDDEQSSISLVDNFAEMEPELLKSVFGFEEKQLQDLNPIEWEDVPMKVYVSGWRKMVIRNKDAFIEIDPTSLPVIVKDPLSSASKFKDYRDGKVLPKNVADYMVHAFGSAFAVTLLNNKWGLHAELGEQVYFQYKDQKIRPFEVVGQVFSGKLSANEWNNVCNQARISRFDIDRSGSDSSKCEST